MSAANFSKIPGSPIAYWVSERFVDAFEKGISIDSISDFTGSQHITADNEKFLRFHWEVYRETKWKSYAKGGSFRRWYGNIIHVVDWSNDAKEFYQNNKTSNLLADKFVDQPGITYTDISSYGTGFRCFTGGAFDKAGPVICNVNHFIYIIALLNTKVFSMYAVILNPTIHLQVRDIKSFPILLEMSFYKQVDEISTINISLSKTDWDASEISWDFKHHPLV